VTGAPSSVSLTIHRSEPFIHACVRSILDQTVGDLEVVIVEDPPFDHAEKILNGFNDNRITYVRNRRHDGISRSRNRSVEMANGDYVFFTDAIALYPVTGFKRDCAHYRSWAASARRGGRFMFPKDTSRPSRTL
jgi:cellulose synthase/poly-beta-1,6-N-acetylglucosamine synthase-like glycosyltransferase